MDTPWMTTDEARLYARCGRRQLLAALHTVELIGTQRTAPNGTWRIHRDDVDLWLRGETAGAPVSTLRPRGRSYGTSSAVRPQ